MNFEKEERDFQELLQGYGVRIQSMEECWEMTYADFAFRREGRNLVTSLKKHVFHLRECLRELRKNRWEIWKLEKGIKKKESWE